MAPAIRIAWQAAAIPLPARIMAVADVYDALISPRASTSPPSRMTEAVAIIRAGRGAHFDPGLVDVFDGLHERFAEIAIQYRDGE
jgi:putative two-component system response regulator